MSKKIFATLAVFTMLCAMTTQVFAYGNANAFVGASVNGNGQNRTVEITVVDDRGMFDEVFGYTNGSANGSYTVGPYDIYIVFSGNSVSTASITDHACVNDVVVTEPTCIEEGFTTYTCYICGDSYDDDYVDALGHDYVGIVTEPTCMEEGFTTYTCSRCGDWYVDDFVAELGHDYIVVTVEATCQEEGRITTTCSRCDYFDIEVIPVLEDCDCCKPTGFVFNGVQTTMVAVTGAKYVSIVETAKNSRVWALTFDVIGLDAAGGTVVFRYVALLSGNNANLDGKYDNGIFVLTYDIKGNGSNIKAFSIKQK